MIAVMSAMREELASWGVDTSGTKEELVARLEQGPPPKPAQSGKEPEVSPEAVAELEARIGGMEATLAAILAKLG